MRRLLNFALGVAIVDGGFIVGVQVVTFLLTYFLRSFIIKEEANVIVLLITLIGLLNLSAILYRITGIAKGIRYSPVICYHQALKRLPYLATLYMVLGLLFRFMPMNRESLSLFLVSMLPYGVITCVYVVVFQKDPFRAILATISSLKERKNILYFALLSLLYLLPLVLYSKVSNQIILQYLELIASIWFLFCHILTVVFFVDSIDKTPQKIKSNQKPTKVIII